MKPSPLSRRWTSSPLAIPLVLAILFGMTVVLASSLPPKWFVSIVLALVFLNIIFITRKKEKFILYASVLLLPISFDFYLINLKFLPYSLPITGFRISAFDLLFFALLGFWLFRLATEPLKVRLYPYISVPFAILLIICLFSSISSPIPDIIKISYIWYAIENWIIFLYIANNVCDRKTVFIIVSLFLLSTVLQSFLAMGQYASGGTLGLDLFGESEKGFFIMKAGAGTVNRVAGTLGHPNHLGGFLGMWIPVNLALIFAPIPKHFKFMLVPSLVLIFVGIILTLSRGAWVGLSIGGGITLFWCVSRRTGNKVLSGFLTTILLVIVILSAVALFQPARQRLFKSDYGSAYVRIPLAKLALNMIRQNPLLGVGPGSFHASARKYDTTREAISYSFPAPVHNTFLLIASELGLPALAIIVFIAGYMFLIAFRAATCKKDSYVSYLAIGFFGALSVWIIDRMVDYEYIIIFPSFWFNLGLLVATTELVTKKPSAQSEIGGIQKKVLLSTEWDKQVIKN